MMKRTILLLSLLTLFMGNTLQANPQYVDSLKQVVDSQTGEQKVNTLNEIAFELIKADNLTEAQHLVGEASELATQLNYNDGVANSHDNQGFIYQSKFDYTNAMKQFVNALKLRNDTKNIKGIATSKNNIGKVFFLQEDIKSALENLIEALKLRKEAQDMEGTAETHKNLGDVNLFKKLYGKAKDHYRQAMEIKISLNDLKGGAAIASFLGNIVSDLGDSEGALVYFNMSLDLNNSVEDMPAIAMDYFNIAGAMIDQASYEEAAEANETAFKIRKQLNDKLGMAACYKMYGEIYAKSGNTTKAEENLEKSVIFLKETGDRPGTQDIYKDIANTYAMMNKYNKAYEFEVAYSKSRDFLYNEDKSRALLELTTKYESEFEAEKQKQLIESLETQQTYNARFRYFMYALLGLGLMLLLVMYRSYTQKKKDYQLLQTKNNEIEKQKEEINIKNDELEATNSNLDVLNQKLVKEMAERESIERSSFARDRFLATMSHEMRTPMNIIIGLTHLLLEDDPRQEQAEHLRTLQFSANNLVVFINDVLDFSKIEAGKLTLESRVFDPYKSFDDVRQRYRLPAKDKGLALEYNIDRKIPENLMGDPTRLNQIVSNLIGFSIQNTEAGKVDVVVKLDSLSKQDATLRLEVTDTSKGISPDKIEEMFRTRSQNQNDIFEGYDSNGFGLTITKRLVDLQNGNITVENMDGKGCKFVILLPFKVAKPETVAEKARIADTKEKNYDHLMGSKILLVEDNKINQLVVAKMLRKLNVEVVTADNGFEAMDAFEDSYFDLVLMDIQMPGMDGYRATAEIRKSTDPRKRDVPIIALTASAFLTEKEKAKLFGMNDHVGKPFGPEDLLEKIGKCMSVYKS